MNSLPTDRQVAGKPCAFKRAGHEHAGGRVGRAADNLQWLVGADVYGANAQSISARMWRDGFDAADDDACERRGGGLQLFDFEARHRELLGERLCRQRRVDISTEPLFGEAHRRTYVNCARKRKSFS